MLVGKRRVDAKVLDDDGEVRGSYGSDLPVRQTHEAPIPRADVQCTRSSQYDEGAECKEPRAVNPSLSLHGDLPAGAPCTRELRTAHATGKPENLVAF